MKALLLGYGSIGQRHAGNLRELYPDVDLYISDPPKGYIDPIQRGYDFAIIASPTSEHLAQMIELARLGIPFLCEKPPCDEIETSQYCLLVDHVRETGLRCAIGFQYRFHYKADNIRKMAKLGDLSFIAHDDLIGRYGATVGGTMASHAIDLALWANGPAPEWSIKTDGVGLGGDIYHDNGHVSRFDIWIDTSPRVSFVQGMAGRLDLDPDDGAYKRMMQAYVSWVMGGPAVKLATLRDGLAVMEILSK